MLLVGFSADSAKNMVKIIKPPLPFIPNNCYNYNDTSSPSIILLPYLPSSLCPKSLAFSLFRLNIYISSPLHTTLLFPFLSLSPYIFSHTLFDCALISLYHQVENLFYGNLCFLLLALASLLLSSGNIFFAWKNSLLLGLKASGTLLERDGAIPLGGLDLSCAQFVMAMTSHHCPQLLHWMRTLVVIIAPRGKNSVLANVLLNFL